MRILVPDASALLEYLFGTAEAARVGESLRATGVDLHVPALCDVELVSGVRRGVLQRALTRDRAHEALQDYLDLPITRHGHQLLLPRMLELRANFTAYDATYVALAEHVTGELLTSDERLARAVRTHTDIAVLP